MSTKTKPRQRRGRPPADQLGRPDVPYTMKLPDGRTLYVEVPGRWSTTDRDGTTAFLPDGVKFLDRVRALAMKLDRPPSPAYITSVREALGMTQAELAERLGVDKMSVSRWERGVIRPGAESLAALENLRKRMARQGVTLPT